MNDDTHRLEVRQPRAGELIRLSPNPGQHMLVTLALDDNDGTYYLVDDKIAESLRKKHPDKIRLYMLRLACNSDGEFFLWPAPADDVQ
jgi:hypothetical protein